MATKGTKSTKSTEVKGDEDILTGFYFVNYVLSVAIRGR